MHKTIERVFSIFLFRPLFVPIFIQLLSAVQWIKKPWFVFIFNRKCYVYFKVLKQLEIKKYIKVICLYNMVVDFKIFL